PRRCFVTLEEEQRSTRLPQTSRRTRRAKMLWPMSVSARQINGSQHEERRDSSIGIVSESLPILHSAHHRLRVTQPTSLMGTAEFGYVPASGTTKPSRTKIAANYSGVAPST
ncbi:unnamed protein product, partial [Ectocarpus sp. 12 AP-2014]